MASVREKIFETIADMPEQQAAEVLSFAESLKAGLAIRQLEVTGQSTEADDWSEFEKIEKHKAKLMACFSQFQIDMTGFKFDREEANARR
jgi:hypothetical protein